MDSSTTGKALVKAQRIWQTEAAVIRGELRQRGVRGDLRTLDLMASGTRGVSAPIGLTRVAIEMRDHGLSEAAIVARLTHVAEQIAALVCHDSAA
jgi:hypothetical protein